MMSIGEIIRTYREERHISQETLSFGICSVSNLSRIENGLQVPARATYEALMERMGVAPEIFPSFLNDREVEAFRLSHQIDRNLIAARFEEAEALLQKFSALPISERVHTQFVHYVQAILLRHKGGTPEDVLEAMKRAAKLSIKDISPPKIIFQVLTRVELSILNNLAISYDRAGMRREGIELLYALKDYIERKVVDADGISPMYTAILHSLTNWVGLDGRYSEVLRLCEPGIQRCIEYGAYFSFAALLFNKGYALVMLGRKEEARKYLQEAYYINRARNKLPSCEINLAFAQEHGIEI